MVSSAYLRLLLFLPAILIPACASSSPASGLLTLDKLLNFSQLQFLPGNRRLETSQGYCHPPPREVTQIKPLAMLGIQRHSIQFSSVAQWCLTPCDPMNCSMARSPCPSSTPGVHSNSCPSSQQCLCRPLLFLTQISPNIRVFSNETTLQMRWPKYWRFSLSISSSNEYPGLISFRIDWLALLAVQGTLKSLLQHHSSKAKPLDHSGMT